VGQAAGRGEAFVMIFGKMKKRTREKLYRAFTLVFLLLFVLTVAAALLITGLQTPVAK
jgi:hypothetical protein